MDAAEASELAQAVWFCEPGSAAFRRAERAIEDVREAAENLTPGDDPAPANAALARATADPCLWLAALLGRPDEASSAAAFQAFVARGGVSWLRAALRPIDHEGSASLPVPPTMPVALTPHETPRHRLAPWLCDRRDTECGRDTGGMLERARRAYARRSRAWHDADEPEATATRCLAAATRRSGARRLRAWARCVAVEFLEPVIPFGRFRAPDRGWWVLHDSRRHDPSCHSLRAYDLESGEAHIAERCWSTVLHPNGAIDLARTRATEHDVITRGEMPRAHLREAALLTLIANYGGTTGRPSMERVPIPAELVLRPCPSAEEDPWPEHSTSGFTSSVLTSHATSVRWHLALDLDRDPDILHTYTWPPAEASPLGYAAELLEIAERGFTPSCGTRRPPVALPMMQVEGGWLRLRDIRAGTDSPNEERIHLLRDAAPAGCPR